MKPVRSCLALLVALAACGPEPRPATPPPREAHDVAPPASSSGAPLSSLTLPSALALLDEEHPELAALRDEVEAAEARGRAAGRLPEPTALVRAENVPLHRGRSLDQGNYIAGLSLLLPLGGRLAAARAVEDRVAERLWVEGEGRRLELHRRARRAFVQALVAEEGARLHARAAAQADETLELLRRRAGLGDAPRDQVAWTRVDAAMARVAADDARSRRTRALLDLAAALGTDRPVISVAGELAPTLGVPDLERLLKRLDSAPGALAADAEVRLREAALDLARAERVPDLRLELAYRRLEQTDQHAVDAGIEVGLPFTGARGDLVLARALEVDAARARLRAARTAAARDAREAHARLERALARARALAGEALPAADEAVAAAEARLRLGDVSVLEVLPARRARTALALDRLGALADALDAWADLRATLGLPLVEAR